MSTGEGERLLELRVPARAEQLRRLRAAVSQAAAAGGCGEQCVHDVVLAVDEACQNVIRHAYKNDPGGEIIVEVRRRADTLVVHVVDFAPPVDVRSIKPRRLDDLRPGGLGTHFIETCMDEARFEPPPEGAGNLLRMVKRIS